MGSHVTPSRRSLMGSMQDDKVSEKPSDSDEADAEEEEEVDDDNEDDDDDDDDDSEDYNEHDTVGIHTGIFR